MSDAPFSCFVALKAAHLPPISHRFAHIGAWLVTIGDDGAMVDLLQAFRAKRGGGIYETTGVASDTGDEKRGHH